MFFQCEKAIYGSYIGAKLFFLFRKYIHDISLIQLEFSINKLFYNRRLIVDYKMIVKNVSLRIIA